jgi:hypothetical protein
VTTDRAERGADTTLHWGADDECGARHRRHYKRTVTDSANAAEGMAGLLRQ